ncbi:MAG: hypothetical protein JO265_00295 [Acidimicrobiia bacterium]|nr:hypothetical protein [Acidimicrobiia bacterium]
MRSHVIRWLAIPALVAGMALPVPAWAQAQQPPSGQVPSVGVTPANTSPNDPNGGQWFFIDNLLPGQTGTSAAKITNPADVPQTLHLYLADLNFAPNGGAQVADEGKSVDIGSWGGFGDNSTLTIGPRQTIVVPFSVTVPSDAEPGDHVGSVVVSAPPQDTGNGLKIERRVATRLYVTLPGEARAAFSIQKVSLEKDSSFYTKEITTRVVLHNDGRVRLRPTVLINGKQAQGSSVLLSNSIEPYFITQKVPVWGGPVSSRIEVRTKVGQAEGPARQQTASTFVIPYVLLIGLVLLVGFVFLVRWLWSRRGGKYAAIQADLRRFERLLEQQRAAGVATTDTTHDAELAIKQAIKQAGRAGDKETEIKLRDKLAELREQEAVSPPPPSAPSPAPTSPAPAAAVTSIPQPAPLAAPAPEVVPVPAPEAHGANGNEAGGNEAGGNEAGGNEAHGNGAGGDGAGGNEAHGSGHAREDDASLIAVLQALATAPPGGQRFALIRAARNYGREALDAHHDEVAALPDDVRVRLLRTMPPPVPSEIA